MLLSYKSEDRTEADLLRLEEMVGRRQEIDTFQKLVQTDGVHLLVISGGGGIGKTRLLQYLVNYALPRDKDKYLVAQDYIDLIHIATHDRERFARLLVKSFPTWDQYFPEYKRNLSTLETLRMAGKAEEAAKTLKDTLQSLCAELAAISETKHLVFVLDTGERWIYNLHSGDQKADAWDWLLCLMKKLHNATILIAGRETVDKLAIDARKQKVNVQSITLQALSEEETRQYISKVIEKQGIEFLAEEYAALHTLSQGMPILLSLALENYLTSSNIRSLRQLVELDAEYRSANEERRKWLLKKFEGDMIGSLMSEPGIKEILMALGRAPKGVNADLMAALLEIDPRLASNRIKEARRYVFVKEYNYSREYEASDVEARLFLHDRIYELLREQVFIHTKDNTVKEKAYEKINSYYSQEIQRISRDLTKGYDQISLASTRSSYSRELVLPLETYRSQLNSELLYYSLHYKPDKGLRRLVRFIQEAIHVSTPEILILLEIELSGYLAGVDLLPYPKRDPELMTLLQYLLKLIPAYRAHAIRSEEALDLTRKLAEEITTIEDGQPTLFHALKATVHSLEGTIYLSRRQPVNEAYDAALVEITKVEKPPEWLTWYLNYLRGTIYYGLGYNHRILGRFKDAVKDYQAALSIWHTKVKFKTPEATTLNDMGFALAEQGQYYDARVAVTKALNLREQLGLGFSIGLSKNTMARIHLLEGNFREAEEYAQQAYTLFTALSDRYGEGLALIALAEISRRLVSDPSYPTDYKQKYDLLQKALGDASQAAEIFSPDELNEHSRYVEALIEKGSVLRDQVRYYDLINEHARINRTRCINDSRAAYQEAIKIATERKIIYRVLDAQVNLAWLEYFIGSRSAEDIQRIEKVIREAQHIFQEKGYTWENAVLKEEELKQKDLYSFDWTRLGKLFTLKGHLALAKYQAERVEKHLKEAANCYLESLEYDRVLGDDYRDMRQAKNGILNQLEQLDIPNLEKFSKQVHKAEDTHHLNESILHNYMSHIGLWTD